MSTIKTEIEQFEPIFLREMADVNLMNRIDTKFAFRQDDLLRFLPILAADYRALKVEGTMLPHYESLYFDDASFSSSETTTTAKPIVLKCAFANMSNPISTS